MPSITYWSQLQPSPHAPTVAEGLAAKVRDPAWLLSRQWQLGEFQGLNGGSPAYVRIGAHTSFFETANLGTRTVPLASGELLEPVVEAEPVSIDLATRVELGQTFESLITKPIAKLFRAAYPIAPAESGADRAETRFRSIVAGRVTDGVALYHAAKTAKAANHELPDTPALAAASHPKVVTAIDTFIDWVESTWGALADDDPPAWDPSQLDYSSTVSAAGLTLTATPDAESALDWHAFDIIDGTPLTSAPTVTSVVPGHVRFRGMPNPRWWDFESGQTDFGGLIADTRDLTKLLFADFMLIHGDDWYVARLDVPRGSLCWIDTLQVTDVFGETTPIPRAGSAADDPWTMFSTTDRSGGPAGFLVTPASAAAAVETSTPVEQVDMLRDETADMAWAVEHVVQSSLGVPVTLAPTPIDAVPTDAPAAFAYLLSTPLPTNWFPLLPVVTAADGLALTVGTLDVGHPPASRLIQRLASDGVEIPQHEISRSGLRLERIACRTRTPDGHSRSWIARRKRIGAGETSSGLRFDQVAAIPADP